MRLSLRAKEGLVVAALVGLTVAIATAINLLTVARLGLDDAAATGALLARQIFLQGSRALTGARGAPEEILQRDGGMRTLLDSTVGYSATVVYGTIADPNGRVLVHSDPDQVGRWLPARQTVEGLPRRNPFQLLRTLFGPSLIFEAQVPLTLGTRPFGVARVGISTGLVRRELQGALGRSLLMGSAAFALALGAGVALGGVALRPLRLIVAEVARLARGEKHEPLAVDRGDELGELAAKLNLLGEQIQEHRTQLLGEKGRFEQMVRVLQDAIMFLNRDGQLIFANPAAENLLGRRLEDLVGRRLKEVLPPDHPFTDTLDVLLGSGTSPASYHLDLKAPDGTRREVCVSAYAIVEDGGCTGAVIAIQDLEPVKAVQSLVDYSVRLADLGRLTSGVAHEVKNPLNAMTIHLELLRGSLPLDSPEARESLEVIEKEIRRLDRVVQDFLKFVRPQELNLRPLDVPTLFREVTDLVEGEAAQAGVRIKSVVGSGTPAAMADADLLRQALLNLLQNAIQAMPEAGDVMLRAGPGPEGDVDLSIEDHGVGIPEEDLEKVFRLYYTTKPEGNGIGLALVYRTIQMHGGTIRIQSVVARGTTVRISLPHLRVAGREVPA